MGDRPRPRHLDSESIRSTESIAKSLALDGMLRVAQWIVAVIVIPMGGVIFWQIHSSVQDARVEAQRRDEAIVETIKELRREISLFRLDHERRLSRLEANDEQRTDD